MRSNVLWLIGSLILVLAPGCGGDGIRHANVSPETMPSGQSFTGVYHSPQYGEMQLVQTGTQIVGEYTQDERHGRIQGTAQGNLMRFEWTEERELVHGRPTTTRGHGYFRYVADGNGVDWALLGEWGHDQNETGGGPWNASRDRRRQPHLTSGTSGGSSASSSSSSTSSGSSGDGLEDLGPSGGGSSSTSSGSSGSSSGSGITGLDDL
jgi:hypothetical protein